MNESGYSWVICDNSIWLRITLKRVFPSFWWPIPGVLVLVDFTLKYARTQYQKTTMTKKGKQGLSSAPRSTSSIYVNGMRVSFSPLFCPRYSVMEHTELFVSREIQLTKDDRCQTGEFLPSNQNGNYPLHCFYEYRPLSWSDLPVSQHQIPE